MKSKTVFNGKGLVTAILCGIFLVANLAAIGGGGRRRAKEALCLSNLRQWGVVYEMFADDHEGRFCTGFWYQLYPYYRDFKLLLCPSATVPHSDSHRGGKFEAWVVQGGLPADWGRQDVLGSYGANGHVGGAGMKYTSSQTDWLTVGLKGADRAPVLLDGARGGVPRVVDQPPEYDGQIYYGYDPKYGTPDINEIRNFCINRHNGGVNCLFLDFSARKVGLKELWVLKWHREWPDDIVLPEWPEWMQDFKDYSGE